MTTPDLVVFGEVALDIILAGVDQVPRRWSILGRAKAARAFTAGTGGYVAQCFSRLGGRASVAGKIGNDATGRLLLAGFKHHRVSTNDLLVVQDASTEISTVVLYNDGNRSSVVSDILPLRLNEFITNHLVAGRAFHFAGYLLYPNLWRGRVIPLLKKARHEECLVSVDPQMSATGEWSGPFSRILNHLDVLMLDEGEVRKISKKKRLTDALEKLLKDGPRVVAVKTGARGCVIGYDDRIRAVRGYQTHPVSTVGAGDAFDAAFIYGTLKKWSIEETAHFANVVGAISTTAYGCMTAIPRAGVAEKLSESYYHHD